MGDFGGMDPEVAVTMRQLYIPTRVGASLVAGGGLGGATGSWNGICVIGIRQTWLIRHAIETLRCIQRFTEECTSTAAAKLSLFSHLSRDSAHSEWAETSGRKHL